jgi:membrane-bound metal-dependent hydrolase YbcI (DUF457 family)
MPYTPFHLGFAWPVFMLNKRKLHFMCLSFGAMVPDLELMFLLSLGYGNEIARGPMHSLLGALTIDILIVLIIAYFLVPPIGRWFKRNTKYDWHIFAGVDVTRAPPNPAWAVVSAMIGTLSHVIIDVFTHTYNPLYWPYTQHNPNWMLFGDRAESSLIFIIPLAVIIITMLLLYWTKKEKRIPAKFN